MTGVQHFVEASPLMLFLIAGWLWPRIAGIAVLFVGVMALLLWIVMVATARRPLSGWSLA